MNTAQGQPPQDGPVGMTAGQFGEISKATKPAKWEPTTKKEALELEGAKHPVKPTEGDIKRTEREAADAAYQAGLYNYDADKNQYIPKEVYTKEELDKLNETLANIGFQAIAKKKKRGSLNPNKYLEGDEYYAVSRLARTKGNKQQTKTNTPEYKKYIHSR